MPCHDSVPHFEILNLPLKYKWKQLLSLKAALVAEAGKRKISSPSLDWLRLGSDLLALILFQLTGYWEHLKHQWLQIQTRRRIEDHFCDWHLLTSFRLLKLTVKVSWWTVKLRRTPRGVRSLGARVFSDHGAFTVRSVHSSQCLNLMEVSILGLRCLHFAFTWRGGT